jgi:pilus assembly protein CpaF
MDIEVTKRAIGLINEGLGPLRSYLEDPSVTEIMVNRSNCIFIERAGTMERLAVDIGEEKVLALIKRLGKLAGKDVASGTASAIVDSRFDGMRIAAVLAPTAYNGHAICIRRHSTKVFELDSYVASGRMDLNDPEGTESTALLEPPPLHDVARGGEALMRFLTWLIKSKQNFLVAGSTGSGKTALLNSLIAQMDDDSRILTIEDTHELVIDLSNVVILESNEQVGITSRMLVKLALRFRPDRILMGEVRGAEAFDLMRAVNSGHKGCFATLHANSAADAMGALEKMILTAGVDWPLVAIRGDIAAAFPYVIFAERRAKRSGVISEVVRINGLDRESGQYSVTPIFKRRPYESLAIAA